jgi:ribose-phosphate pyrophosphokinase
MVRNLVVLGGSSHPELTNAICANLGVPPAKILLGKFAVGETRVEVQESVRGKDVFIIQSGGGKVNDHLMELLITISACRTASAKRITAVLPLFPYSRQSDIPYNKSGAPLSRVPGQTSRQGTYTFDSLPQTPHPGQAESIGLSNGVNSLQHQLGRLKMDEQRNSTNGSPTKTSNPDGHHFRRSDTVDSSKSDNSAESVKSGHSAFPNGLPNGVPNGLPNGVSKEKAAMKVPKFEGQPGYKQWVAQAGTLIADLLTCAGADHVITMDLHDPQYQGFFDIPVDNLYGRHMLRKYIQYNISDYQQAVIVSPDAGGAKRATAVADALGMPFALIHKVCNAVKSAQAVL